MPRGGRRSGKSGVAYGNRTDLQQAPKAAPGQAYGVAQMQRDAQKAVPIAGTQVPAPQPMSPTPGGAAPMGGGSPMGGPVPLDAESSRPDEPVQHGLPMGAGGGPEVLDGGVDANSQVTMQLRAIYSQHPTEQLRALIEQIETGDDA